MNYRIIVLTALFLICSDCQNKNLKGTEVKSEIKKKRWRLVTSYPNSLNVFSDVVEYFRKNTEVLSNDMIRLKTYQPGEMVPALGVFDAVSKGSVEMGVTAGYYYMGKNTAFIFDTGEPFGLDARSKNAWLYECGGLQLLQELYKKYNIMYFPFGNTGAQMGGWFSKEINSLEDLKGLRLRVPGIGGKIYSELGASVQVLGAGDIFPALEQGALDGAEFVGPHDDQKLGFHQVTSYYYSPGWQECGATIGLYINLEKWKSLSIQEQKIIANLAKVCNQMMLTRYDYHNSKALDELHSKNIKIREFNNDIVNAAKEKNQEILNQYSKENPDFKKIYQSIKDFKKISNDWMSINEYRLIKFK